MFARAQPSTCSRSEKDKRETFGSARRNSLCLHRACQTVHSAGIVLGPGRKQRGIPPFLLSTDGRELDKTPEFQRCGFMLSPGNDYKRCHNGLWFD